MSACTAVEEHMVIRTVFTMLHGVTQHPYSSLISHRKMRKMGRLKGYSRPHIQEDGRCGRLHFRTRVLYSHAMLLDDLP